jgi:hypothetical protein
MTAPCPNIKTVFVDSEKGSRLPLPATARAPFTVTATSSATGCVRGDASAGDVPGEPATGRAVAFSGMDVNISFSFAAGDMSTLARTDFSGIHEQSVRGELPYGLSQGAD